MNADVPQASQWLADALGKPPFPWQERLLGRFLAGDLPRALDLPTGLGKTSVMAIWLVARACGAPLPRRLVYVVDRRAVVDQATKVAEDLRRWLEARPEVATKLGLQDRTLPISTLRGQHADNREWMEDPTAAAVIVGTVDMTGSRLLFEGYRSTRKIRPYQAGLLGSDTLIILDEAHLVPPFERLIEAVATDPALHARATADRARLPALRLLSLSATGRDHGADAFRLEPTDASAREVDGARHVLWKRLHAPKRIELVALKSKEKLADALAEQALGVASAAGHPTRVVVFTNKRDDAEKVATAIRKRSKASSGRGDSLPTVDLMVGSRRVRERANAAKRLADLGFLAGSALPTTHAFLVATSAGEVGVDLDADHAVCDFVAWERTVQRLGRVNRRGQGDARVVIVSDPESQWTEPVTSVIRCLPEQDGRWSASPANLDALTRNANFSERVRWATTAPPLHPPLTRALVEAWAMTSLEEHTGRPEITPWLRGWTEDDPQTSVLWRSWLPTRDARAYFEAAPPHTNEVLETETWRVAEWLVERATAFASRLDKDARATRQDDVVAFLLPVGGREIESRRLRELLIPALPKKEQDRAKKDLHRALAGRTLVVDARLGGLSEDGLLDTAADATPSTEDGPDPSPCDTAGKPVVLFRVAERLADAPTQSDPNWRERYRQPLTEGEGDGDVVRWLVVEKWRHDAENEDDRSAGRAQLLTDHQQCAAMCAETIATKLGLTNDDKRVLVTAARLHDEGKRAERWQRAFHAAPGQAWAKTLGPIDFKRLDHYRHELGSLPYAERDPGVVAMTADDRDMVLHLIAAHHGFARPLLPTDGCDDAPPSVLAERARIVADRFARLQARWGPWGLAWWEALLRAADQQASRMNDAQGGA